METANQTKKINQILTKTYGKYPEKIIQFGEGNFLRAFVDWMIDLANESGGYKGSIAISIGRAADGVVNQKINAQDGLYTLVMRGLEDGKKIEKTRVINSVSRSINIFENYDDLTNLAQSPDLEVVVSNTTEAGIAYAAGDKLADRPQSSFPGKVTAFLYARYKFFNGAADKGLLFLPVELIDHNGDELKKIILTYAKEWGLEPGFTEWVNTANKFTNTLVDRIVTGYPKDEAADFEKKLGYQDGLIVTSELFNLWVIEGKKEWADILPVHKTSANVIWTDDVSKYKTRKVRILNGAHTSTVLAAYLAGHNIVLDFMRDALFAKYLKTLIADEVIPTLDLPKKELEDFANAVCDRFANPFIKHNLLDISLNSCAKFNTRCLPSLTEYVKRYNKIPKLLAFSLAAFIKFYQGSMEGGVYAGTRPDGTKYPIKDGADIIAFFDAAWRTNDVNHVAQAVLGNEAFWGGKDLTAIPGLADIVADYLLMFNTMGAKQIITEILK